MANVYTGLSDEARNNINGSEHTGQYVLLSD